MIELLIVLAVLAVLGTSAYVGLRALSRSDSKAKRRALKFKVNGFFRALESRGLRVVMTRERDEFVPLERRTSLANDAHADLFVSIHANAARNPAPRGTSAAASASGSADQTRLR